MHDPHAPGFTVALGGVDVDRVDDPVNPAAVEDGAPALRTVGNRQVIAHGASLARILREVRLGVVRVVRLAVALFRVNGGVITLMAEAQERIGAEPLSRVMFDIEPLGELVKLTVVHDGFEPGRLVAKLVTQAGRPSSPA